MPKRFVAWNLSVYAFPPTKVAAPLDTDEGLITK
jgi:hypothetical protein